MNRAVRARPYRTHWRTVDPEQLWIVSQSNNRSDDPYRPYEEERALIIEWRNKNARPPASLLTRWALHPDERVRGEVLRSPQLFSWIDTASYPSRALAWENWKKTFSERVIMEMQAEGVSWSPLFDEIVCANWIHFHPVVENAINILVPWLQTQATHDDVREILRSFHAHGIHDAVLMYAGCIDRKLAREIYEQLPRDHSIAVLGKNVSLSAEVVAALAEWIAEDWEARMRGAPAIRNNSWTCLSNLLWQHPSSVPLNVVRRIYALPKLAQDLGVRTIGTNEYLARRNNPQDEGAAEIALYELTIFSQRINWRKLSVPSDVLCAAVPLVKHNTNALRALLRHPSADVTVWRAGIRHIRAREIHEHAARNPELRRDPEIRECLLRSRRPEIIALLAEDTDPQVAADAVRGLIAINQLERAAQILTTRGPEQPIALKPEDLVPLLQSDAPNVRLAAVVGLGQLQSHTQPTPMDTKPSRPGKERRKNP